jgi:hypothetical protein
MQAVRGELPMKSSAQPSIVGREQQIGGAGMYDVLYLDHDCRSQVLARSLNREAAAELARLEARRRHGGRMFLVGSERPQMGGVVLIVAAEPSSVAA